MLIPRSRLLSVVLVVPVLLAWFEGKGPHPVPSGAPVASPSAPAASIAPSTPSVPPSTPPALPSTPPVAPSVPVPASPQAPAPSVAAPPSPSAPASATTSAPGTTAPGVAPSPAASPASGRKPSGSPGMATLEGHTYEMVDGKLTPVNKSEIMIPELSLETFSKPNGRFAIKHIPVREKPYEIMIIHPGFENLYEKRVFDKEERFKYDFTIKRKGF